MAKTYADWTQTVEEKKPRKKVHTRANTSFNDWMLMVTEEFAKAGVDINLPYKLAFLHAWECDNTPYGFAEEWSRRVRRNGGRANMGPSGFDGGA